MKLHVFVYGTLKRGGSNFARHCGGAVSVEAAWVWGRLRIFANRYPLLCIPRDDVMAVGSADYAADLALPLHGRPVSRAAEGQWIEGELMVFSDGVARLPRLDALENFAPPGAHDGVAEPAAGLRTHFGYERVLAPVSRSRAKVRDKVPSSGTALAWMYVCPPGFEERFPLFDDEVWDERTWRQRMGRKAAGS